MTHFCQRSDESSFFSRWFGLCTSEKFSLKTLWAGVKELFNLTEFKPNRKWDTSQCPGVRYRPFIRLDGCQSEGF